MFALSFGFSVRAARDRERVTLDDRLAVESAERATVAAEYFDRARSLILLLAHNRTFIELRESSLASDADAATSDARIAEAQQALLHMQGLYRGRINEICFIDRGGAELARVTREVVAAPDELSPDESGNPFFAPTFALAPGEVYQGKPYVSPDTGEWVISNSTPVFSADGTVPAIMHFEVTLESFRALLTREGYRGVDSQIIDARSGAVLSDSRFPQATGARLGQPDDRSLSSLAATSQDGGKVSIGERRAVFRRVVVDAGNQNDWLLVVSAPQATATWSSNVDAASFSSLSAALALLALGVFAFRAHNRRLQHLAFTDDLTGLANRNRILEQAAERLNGGATSRRFPAVLVIDLDGFKDVNDTLGPEAGDRLLASIGPRIAPVLGHGDAIARIGGDVFVVLLGDVASVEAAEATARRIGALIEAPFLLTDIPVRVEASIGLAVAPQHGEDAHHLLQRADLAMHAAKRSRVGVRAYDPSLDTKYGSKLFLLGDMRTALEQDELVLYYQPQVHLDTLQPHGMEALIRWQHPTRGLIFPDHFIPLVERTTLIHPLTNYVIDRALAQCRIWLDEGKRLTVSVNISARSLLDPAFPDLVKSLLATHGVPPELLVLEITEGAIMTDPRRAKELLIALHDLRVQIALDDFGTGYSSLAYLKTLPIDELKIDKSFVLQMAANQRDAVIARSVIDLGSNLGLRVVAEGIEENETMTQLKAAGCAIGQGYFWSKPRPAPEITTWLDDQMRERERECAERDMRRTSDLFVAATPLR